MESWDRLSVVVDTPDSHTSCRKQNSTLNFNWRLFFSSCLPFQQQGTMWNCGYAHEWRPQFCWVQWLHYSRSFSGGMWNAMNYRSFHFKTCPLVVSHAFVSGIISCLLVVDYSSRSCIKALDKKISIAGWFYRLCFWGGGASKICDMLEDNFDPNEACVCYFWFGRGGDASNLSNMDNIVGPDAGCVRCVCNNSRGGACVCVNRVGWQPLSECIRLCLLTFLFCMEE